MKDRFGRGRQDRSMSGRTANQDGGGAKRHGDRAFALDHDNAPGRADDLGCVDSVGSRDTLDPLDTTDIFRQLIEDEIRNGRLSSARRRRIVKYAAHLQLSATDVGRLVRKCSNRLLLQGNHKEQRHALKLVHYDPAKRARLSGVRLAIVIACIFEMALLVWML